MSEEYEEEMFGFPDNQERWNGELHSDEQMSVQNVPNVAPPAYEPPIGGLSEYEPPAYEPPALPNYHSNYEDTKIQLKEYFNNLEDTKHIGYFSITSKLMDATIVKSQKVREKLFYCIKKWIKNRKRDLINEMINILGTDVNELFSVYRQIIIHKDQRETCVYRYVAVRGYEGINTACNHVINYKAKEYASHLSYNKEIRTRCYIEKLRKKKVFLMDVVLDSPGKMVTQLHFGCYPYVAYLPKEFRKMYGDFVPQLYSVITNYVQSNINMFVPR